MPKHSRRYDEAAEMVDPARKYTVSEGVEMVRSLPAAKFDETVEIVMNLGIDPRHSDQQVRGTISLPHGTGKEVRVLVFAEGDAAEEAREAGAEFVGGEEMGKKVLDGWADFDVAIAPPSMMRVVGKLGRVLGPQGKMPSPKAGTVTDDVAKAVQEFKAGKIEYRNDKSGNVHAPIGKKSFSADQLVDNVEAFITQIKAVKPAGAKGTYINRVSLSSTMSPAVALVG